MRTLPLSILLGLALVACQQTTHTDTTVGSTTTVKTSTTTDTINVPQVSVDTAETAHAKEELKQGGEKAKEDLRKAAAATGTALEKAGKKLQEKAKH